MLKKTEAQNILKNWDSVNAFLRAVTEAKEKDVWELLDCEMSNARRPQVLFRLHSKASKMRRTRERKGLLSGKF